jgi:hypothetical protein
VTRATVGAAPAKAGPARLLIQVTLALLVAAAAAGLALGLAWHHPLSPAAAAGAVVLAAAATALRPAHWPLWLLPLLPLVGLMPWTGWLVVEELDALLLAVAAGAYARWAFDAMRPPAPAALAAGAARPSRAWWCLLPLVLSTAWAGARGVADAGGIELLAGAGWWQGYREPLNSLRLMKPVLLWLLLLPPWHRSLCLQPDAAARASLWGMVGLLGTVALGVWWERWAYTGMLDFSSDYRATGLFWEMHVGGAALDAALALSVPFAVVALARARPGVAVVGLLALLGVGAYAALATFSRVVYVGLPLGLAVVWWLGQRQATQGGALSGRGAPRGAGAAVAWVLAGLVLAAWLFPAGGYRALLALLGATALVLAGAEATRPLPAGTWRRGLAGGALAALGVAAATAWVPKGAYLAFGLAWLAAAWMLWARFRTRAGVGAGLIVAMSAVLAALVAVPVHWGGATAWAPALAAAVVLWLAWLAAAARRQPAWPTSWRWQGQTLAVLVVGAGVVGVFGGGSYMAQRFLATAEDTSGRQHHWSQALQLLDAEDWLLGKGLGRFLDNFALSGRTEDLVGDYRVVSAPQGSGQVLVLTSGKHLQGWGEMFRVSQRIELPPLGPLKVRLHVRSSEATELHLEVCEKQLLYDRNCRGRSASIKPGAEAQEVGVELTGEPLSRGSAWAPRWIVFSVALATPGRRAEIDDIELLAADGRNLLANGGFEGGMSRWFSTSDKKHLPWHAKNLAVHLLFEQGWLGLLSAALAGGMALWRTSLGAARAHPLAPALAGALVAVGVVGFGDSLLDMPRISWLMWWLVALALLLPGAGQRRGGP